MASLRAMNDSQYQKASKKIHFLERMNQPIAASKFSFSRALKDLKSSR